MQDKNLFCGAWDDAMFSVRKEAEGQAAQPDGRCIAVYLRLSEEDAEVKGHCQMESNSVTNQRKLIRHYIAGDEELSLLPVTEYADDGFSGARFDRPAFTRMMEDAKAGKISVIITKDYSRIGRDYLEVGNYLEYIFPLLQIRYISINDGFDSDKNYGSTGGMNQALKNLVNMMYSRDLSKKTRSAKLTKCRQGKYPFSHLPFGYVRSKEDKNQLVVEPEAAEIVRRIFDLALGGKSCYAIAAYLNESGVETIAEYAGRHGNNWRGAYNFEVKFWHDKSVRAILQNEVYFGRIVGNKTERNIYTNHRLKKNDPEDWIVVDGCHEPIISKQAFYRVQALLEKKRECTPKPSGKKRRDRKGFGGFFICGTCGRCCYKDGKKLYCPARRAAAHTICGEKTVRYDKVMDALAVYVSDFVSNFTPQGKGIKESDTAMETDEMGLLVKEKEHLAAKKFQLYDKYRSGKISRAVFQQENMAVTARREEIERLLDECGNQKGNDSENIRDVYDELKDGISDIAAFDIDKYKKLIRHVIIHGEDSIEVVWNTDDPMAHFQ
ncbi:MAG: recombinase family protein [Clostridium sp.]|nr:recombinase family protein [Clostridium sp.]